MCGTAALFTHRCICASVFILLSLLLNFHLHLNYTTSADTVDFLNWYDLLRVVRAERNFVERETLIITIADQLNVLPNLIMSA